MTDKLTRDFGNKVREIRRLKDVSQEGLAGLADLDRTRLVVLKEELETHH